MNNNNKYNNRNLLLAIIVIFLGVIVIAGSFAYYTWTSGNVKKNILFNTSKALSEYIVYDEGESKFVGDFKIGNSYSDGIHTTISINKTSEAENVDLFATIYLKVNSIGESITNSMAVKWVLVDGDETSTNVISSGNFYGVEANEQFALKNFIPVTTTLKKYTVWIWLDQSENIPSSITGETLDTLVYTQVDQIQVMEKEIFEITKINANYQFINATVINNKNQIVKYNVTKTNTTPSVFNDVGDEYVYCNASGDACNLENYIVNDGTGTYYVWFKDSSENVISKEVNVSNIDATGPVCTFDMFNPSSIKGNETSQINLTCVDEIGIKNSNIDISDISISNNSLLEVNSVIKSAVNNGYKYTIEVKALSLTDNGEVTLTLPANIIQNKANLGNTISTSGNISVLNIQNFSGGSVNITGTNTVGSTLTAQVTDTSPVGTYTYQWWTATSADATSGTAISGATSNTFELTSSQLGKYIGVTVTASKTNYTSKIFSDITESTNNTYATVTNLAVIPTSANYCNVLTYNGSSQVLTKTPGTGYTFSNNTGTNATSYTVTATLSENSVWSDGTTSTKTFSCSISKKAATVTAKNQTINYGSSIATGVGQATLTGQVSNHVLTEVTLTPSTTNATTNGTITPSAAKIQITDTSGTNVTDNYNITYTTGNLTINKVANPISVTASQSWNPSYSTSAQTKTVTAATNAQGSVTYAIKSQVNSGGTTVTKFSLSGTTLTMSASTAADTYTVVITATAAGNTNYNSGSKDITMTVKVNNVDDFTVSASLSGTTLTCSVSGTYSPVSNYNFTKCTSSGCDSYTSGTSTSMNFSLATTGTNKPYYCKAKLIHTNGEVSPEKSSSAVYLKFSLTSSSILCSASSNNTAYPLVYTGSCSISSGQVSFKTSGSKTLYVNTSGIYADIFAVGGGGGGASSHSGSCAAGSGGGGGKTSMTAAYLLTGSSYTITVGAGGAGGTSGGADSAGGTSKFGSVISAAGGGGAEAPTSSISGAAGSGGSGGGRGGRNSNSYGTGGVGGSYGANGSSNGTDAGGSGQGTTTCAFHKGTTSSCTSGYSAFGGGGGGGVGYNKTFGSAPGTGGAGGGGAGGYKLNVSPYNYVAATAGTANTGGGGGGGGTFISSNVCGAKAGGAGGSGIVMMMATDTSLPFSYTGNYETVKNTGSVWEVKLLSNGTFKVTSNTSVDIFCVGGGGGGSSSPAMAVGGAGGGGGYTKTVSGTTLTAGTGYSVTIGAGGAGGKANLSNSTASAGSAGAASKFASLLTANGGSGGVLPTDVGAVGGAGGSGGGAGGRNWSSSNNGGAGGSYGNNGSSNASSTAAGGTGQGSTTCAFGKGTTSSCNSGYKVYAAGGGGGAGYQTANYGAGGTGGGGLGGYVNSSFQYVAATSGTINTGSGGGGGGDWLKNGADGGSGICIVRTHSTS